ncbi:MAG: NAD(P)-binding domain-containing protein, partial [Hyphomicrobiales bacterium]|nr:NAD(P)-binding domain-containing protein [Hyphomicrobiales bacterium]
MSIGHIAVLGGGAWGTALAETAVRAGRKVTLWEFDAGNAEHLASRRESKFLPGFRISDSIEVVGELAIRADTILLVVPAQATRSVASQINSSISGGTPIIVCAKGIERGTHEFMTQIVRDCAPKAIPAILSGPSFAVDVARGLPTAVTLACE